MLQLICVIFTISQDNSVFTFKLIKGECDGIMSTKQYKLGLASVSFRENSAKEILEAAALCGLSYIEWGSDVHAPRDNPQKCIELAKLQAEHGLLCSSYGTYFRLGKHPITELADYARTANILGTHILRIWGGDKSGADMTDTERYKFISDSKKAAAIAERLGIILCLECHVGTFTERPEDTVWLLKEVDSPNLRTYWQPLQHQSFEKNLESAKRLAPSTENIHVFNRPSDKRLPLSLAAEEWREYLCYFHSSHTLLLEFMPNGKIDELFYETKALKSITEYAE